MTAQRKKWTDEDKTLLINLWESTSTDTIAEMLDRTRGSVSTTANQMGLKRTAQSPALLAKQPKNGPWTCNKCAKVLPLENFNIAKDSSKQDYCCKECKKKIKKWRYDNDINGTRTKQLAKEKEINAVAKAARPPKTSNTPSYRPAAARKSMLKTFYGLTVEEYMYILEKQNYVCAVCKKPETRVHHVTGLPVSLAVDHDHACCPGKKSCGKCVRELLCSSCNNTIGHLEKGGLLLAFTEYLEKHVQKSIL